MDDMTRYQESAKALMYPIVLLTGAITSGLMHL